MQGNRPRGTTGSGAQAAASSTPIPEQETIKKNPWISAWSDSVAGVNAYSPQLALSDLKDDGDNKLVVADTKGRLKVYMGTNVLWEH